MTEKVPSRGPEIGVHLEALVQEIPKLVGEARPGLELGPADGGDEVQGSGRVVLLQVGRLPFDHLDGHDAQRPDVHLKRPEFKSRRAIVFLFSPFQQRMNFKIRGGAQIANTHIHRSYAMSFYGAILEIQ